MCNFGIHSSSSFTLLLSINRFVQIIFQHRIDKYFNRRLTTVILHVFYPLKLHLDLHNYLLVELDTSTHCQLVNIVDHVALLSALERMGLLDNSQRSTSTNRIYEQLYSYCQNRYFIVSLHDCDHIHDLSSRLYLVSREFETI